MVSRVPAVVLVALLLVAGFFYVFSFSPTTHAQGFTIRTWETCGAVIYARGCSIILPAYPGDTLLFGCEDTSGNPIWGFCSANTNLTESSTLWNQYIQSVPGDPSYWLWTASAAAGYANVTSTGHALVDMSTVNSAGGFAQLVVIDVEGLSLHNSLGIGAFANCWPPSGTGGLSDDCLDNSEIAFGCAAGGVNTTQTADQYGPCFLTSNVPGSTIEYDFGMAGVAFGCVESGLPTNIVTVTTTTTVTEPAAPVNGDLLLALVIILILVGLVVGLVRGIRGQEPWSRGGTP